MSDTTVKLLPHERRAVVTVTCKRCGCDVPAKNEVAASVFRRYVASGEKQVYCDECRREVGEGK